MRKIYLYCAIVAWTVAIVAGCMLYTANAEVGLVTRVKDGDTLQVQVVGGELITVRLYGIDAPEKAQLYGPEAKAYLSSMVSGAVVTIDRVSIDLYGRVVAMLEIGGQRVQQAMVAAGMAWVYRDYCRKGAYCKELSQLQAQAQSGGKGLWEIDHPQPPWEYRKMIKSGISTGGEQ